MTELEDLKRQLKELNEQEKIEDLKEKVKAKERELRLRPIRKFIGRFQK